MITKFIFNLIQLAMIDIALTYIRDILNEHFKNEFSITENKAILSNLVKADGSSAQNVDGKIVFFLVCLDEESTLKNSLNRSATQDNVFVHKRPALHLNMQLLFCSNFDSTVYIEGLRFLSSLIRFFQVNSKIGIEYSSNSSLKTNRLNFELCNLDYAQLSHLWSSIGSKLMPAVLYKVSMLVFDDVPADRIIPSILETESLS